MDWPDKMEECQEVEEECQEATTKSKKEMQWKWSDAHTPLCFAPQEWWEKKGTSSPYLKLTQ